MRKNIVFVAVAALLVSSTGTFAALTMMHNCTENYYENGTLIVDVTDSQNVVSWSIGDISGNPMWEVTEKAWWDDVANQTIITYTVGNDSISDPITSLHITSSGVDPISINNGPDGWTGFIEDGEYGWYTNDEAKGISVPDQLNTMTVTFSGLRGITYVPVAYDLADGTIVENSNWVVSTVVPAPAAMVLCAMGLGLIGWIKRRFA